MGVSHTAACLGARVRQLRLDRGLTLKALGREAGLWHSFLSQLERGLTRPSMASVGGLEVELEGEIHGLEAGDALRFDGAVPHRLQRRGPANTRALYVSAG